MSRSSVLPLTEAQLRVLHFFREFSDDKGYSPTVREISRALGFRSTNATSDFLRALIRKGALTPPPVRGRNRAVLLTERGRALTDPPAPVRLPATGTVIQPKRCPCGAVHFRVGHETCVWHEGAASRVVGA